MKCIRCGCDETKVLESRLTNDGRSVRRRRICRNCENRFTTYEKEEILEIYIKKKDGHVQPYQREKALRSIQIACQKRKIKIEEIEFMLRRVEAKLQEIGERIVPSRQLGELIMEGLYKLDLVAYVRFASVYKDFTDPNEFYSILKSINHPESSNLRPN
ncbi:MAG: transcriptional regulator NrdR [Oligoflexales bacterium]